MKGKIREFPFPCPHCDGRMEVKDSRPTSFRGRTSVRRRRHCRKCGHRLTTYETISTTTEQQADVRLAAVMLTMRRAHEAMGQLIANFDESDDDEPLKEAAE